MRIRQKKSTARNSKNRAFKLPTTRTSLFTTIVVLVLAFIFSQSERLAEARLPQDGHPPELFANQTRDDLRQVILSGIQEAKQSILLIIYTLTDDKVIQSLRKKSEEGIDVWVICDAKASPHAASKLGSKVRIVKRFATGLMHQKILIVDEQRAWIGSANMTGESLRVHGNLIMAIYSPHLAAAVIKKAKCMKASASERSFSHCNFGVGGQKLELWFFPDDPNGVQRLIQLIRSAEKTVRVAMFTWTRNDLASAVIEASLRGVNTEVVIDRHSGLGSSAGIVKVLCEGRIPVRLSQGNALLHHKFLYIDGKTLVNGSANWTKAAFTKNDDCFIILHDLTEEQRVLLDRLWEVIVAESSPVASQ